MFDISPFMAYICDRMTALSLSVLIITIVLQISSLILTFYIIIKYRFNYLWFLSGILFVVRIASELIVVTKSSASLGPVFVFLNE